MNAQELLRQALEALEAGTDVDPIFAGETIDDLRAALAQPEPEPEPVVCEWPECGCRIDLGEDWMACKPTPAQAADGGGA